MFIIQIVLCLSVIIIKVTESRSKSLPANKLHQSFNDYNFSRGLIAEKTKEESVKVKKSGYKNIFASKQHLSFHDNSFSTGLKADETKEEGVKCPKKEPKVGVPCPDDIIEAKNTNIKCLFKTKKGTKTLTCPGKKWAVFQEGKKGKKTGDDYGMVAGSKLPKVRGPKKNDKACPKKEPKIGKPCGKPETLECEYPSTDKLCYPMAYSCTKGEAGKAWDGIQACH